MTVDEPPRGGGSTLLGMRIARLGRDSGLPVLLAGTTTTQPGNRQVLRITETVGTVGTGSLGLEITAQRGLGGAVLHRRQPCGVSDYARASTITHDYDDVVVAEERIRAIVAYPILVGGAVRGVLFGGTRERLPIGDVARGCLEAAALSLARDLEVEEATRRRRTRKEALAGSRALRSARTEQALRELVALARDVGDPLLRDRLERVHAVLVEPADALVEPGDAEVRLAPRELEVLRLVELGAHNRVIGAQLGLTVTTVKAYLGSAMRKLDVRNRTSAVHAARTRGLL